MDIRKDIQWRVSLSFLLMVLVGIIVIVKAFCIQQFEGTYWQSMGDSLHQKFKPVIAERGSIYSEDGNILSTSVPIFDIYVDFAADNPGQWMVHCHNAYHAEAGMMTRLDYIT